MARGRGVRRRDARRARHRRSRSPVRTESRVRTKPRLRAAPRVRTGSRRGAIRRRRSGCGAAGRSEAGLRAPCPRSRPLRHHERTGPKRRVRIGTNGPHHPRHAVRTRHGAANHGAASPPISRPDPRPRVRGGDGRASARPVPTDRARRRKPRASPGSPAPGAMDRVTEPGAEGRKRPRGRCPAPTRNFPPGGSWSGPPIGSSRAWRLVRALGVVQSDGFLLKVTSIGDTQPPVEDFVAEGPGTSPATVPGPARRSPTTGVGKGGPCLSAQRGPPSLALS